MLPQGSSLPQCHLCFVVLCCKAMSVCLSAGADEGHAPADIQVHANIVQEVPTAAASIDGDDAFAEWLSSGKHALSFLRVPISVRVSLSL